MTDAVHTSANEGSRWCHRHWRRPWDRACTMGIDIAGPVSSTLEVVPVTGDTSMNNMISLRAIRNVRMGMTNSAVISGEVLIG